MDPIVLPKAMHIKQYLLKRAANILSRRVNDNLPNPFNNRSLAELKGIHKGERAFIIGNGPSLNPQDLERLKGEITFASNRIFLAFNETSWRPTYYTVADEIVAQNNLDIINNGGMGRMIFNSSVYKYFGSNKSIVFVNPPTIDGEHHWDLVKGVSAGHSVLNLDLKIAFYMGIRKIYAIGVDHRFKDQSTRTGKIISGNEVIISTGEKNHFHPNYRKAGETWTVPRIELIEQDFRNAAKRYFDVGGTIYNASRMTALNAWPTVSLDTIIP